MGQKILITMGDPHGIGPEILLKSLNDLSYNDRSDIEVVGPKFFEQSYRNLYSEIMFHAVGKNVIPNPGVLNAIGGKFAFLALKKCVSLLNMSTYSALVTAPISKEAIILSGDKDFIGHTEYLGDAFNVKGYSIFYGEKWSVILVTSHIPLMSVSRELNQNRLYEVIAVAVDFHRKFYDTSTTIGVCGLNPHNGEGSMLGLEEQEIVIPIIQVFRSKGIKIEGPIAPDVMFRKANMGQYKTIVALYHDQGLIPFKMLHFYNGIHMTWGLPFVRVSPSHGVAWDIAGKNIANHTGMLNAIQYGLSSRNRQQSNN